MIKDNRGFSMMELLAAIVVLGILMGSAVPIVMNVLSNQRNQTYVDDALRLASNADYKMRSDNDIMVPARGGCVVIDLAYMDNNVFEKAPYGGEYDVSASYVVVRRNRSDEELEEEYTYYVTLVEKTKAGGYRGVNLVDYNLLHNNDAKDKYIESIGNSAILSPMNYADISGFTGLSEALDSIEDIPCSSFAGVYTGYEYE